MVYILNMQKHTFYRVINILVLPLSLFIGIQVVASLPFALSNPPLLLVAFILACIPLYAFTANYFYNKSIRKGEKCKPALKDWIKVNAIVSIIFSVFMLFASLIMLVALNDPKMISELQNQLAANTPTQVSPQELIKLLTIYCYVFLPFCILLMIHIIITFNLLSRYKHMFGYSTNDPQ
jgi:hypothetical protein